MQAGSRTVPANELQGEVEILLDRPRRLKFDWQALATFQQHYGSTFETLLAKLAKIKDLPPDDQEAVAYYFVSVVGPVELRLLLYCALKHEDPDLTVERAGELMSEAPGEMEEQFGFIWGKIWHAFLLTRGAATKKKIRKIVEDMVQKNGQANGGMSSSPSRSDILGSRPLSFGD